MEADYLYRYGAIAIIVKDGKFLVINDMGFNPGDYDFVGGGREGNETPEENLFREIQEEIGLTSESFRLVGKSKHQVKFDFSGGFREMGNVKYKGQIKDAFVLEFLGDEEDINPAPDQVRSYKWVDASELSTHLNFKGQLENAMRIIQDVIPEYLSENKEQKLV